MASEVSTSTDVSRNTMTNFRQPTQAFLPAFDATYNGAKFYAIVRNLVAPEKPTAKSYSELKSTLRKRLKTTPIVVAEQRKFLRRDQVLGESTTDYVVQLKKLSLHCSYGDKLDENLRNRFISGLRDEPTALKLMEKEGEQDNLSFNKAVEFALARESTAESTKAMRSAGETASAAVSANANTVQRSQRKLPRSRKQCYRRSEEPKAENKKKGQYGKKSFHRKSAKKESQATSKTVNKLDEQVQSENPKEHSDSDSEYDFTMLKLHEEGKVADTGAIYVPIEIEGTVVNMEVDTGSGVSMVPLQFYERHLKHIPLLAGDKSLKSFTGQTVKASGKVYVDVRYGNYEGKLKLYVMDCTEYYLLGREWLGVIPLDWKSLISQRPKPENVLKVSELEQVINKHAELFVKGLGRLTGAKAKIILREEAQPVMRKPVKVPYALKEKVEAELVQTREMWGNNSSVT
ncbi:hypothetical protein HOLleu_23298 [Holothuria leucospilota]|uniref:Retrotransposon gag domain-containing protein n=1 Tax=Holothuria leucospilota TaxID=206669 RepID=A0A9Q1H537_HOLLE|nr:hypothetical protein HOLleu_23298 [Holothuria leucospilota]